MELKEISQQLFVINQTLKSIRIQVVRLALNETKQKHPRVVELENKLNECLGAKYKNQIAIDDILEELECLVIIKSEHHIVAQKFHSL